MCGAQTAQDRRNSRSFRRSERVLSPDKSYPRQLEAELRRVLSGVAGHVLNKGSAARKPADDRHLSMRTYSRKPPISYCQSAAIPAASIIRRPAEVIRGGVESVKATAPERDSGQSRNIAGRSIAKSDIGHMSTSSWDRARTESACSTASDHALLVRKRTHLVRAVRLSSDGCT